MSKLTEAVMYELERQIAKESSLRGYLTFEEKYLLMALDEIKRLQAEQRWRLISDMPQEGQFVEVDFGNDEYTVGLWYWENEPAEWSNGTDYIQWEHWNIGAERMETSNEPPINWRPLPKL